MDFSVLKDFLESLLPSVQIHFQRFISEVCGLCLLDSFFQDLFLGVSGELSVLSKFFGGRFLGFVVMEGMPGASFCLVYFWVVFSFIAVWV